MENYDDTKQKNREGLRKLNGLANVILSVLTLSDWIYLLEPCHVNYRSRYVRAVSISSFFNCMSQAADDFEHIVQKIIWATNLRWSRNRSLTPDKAIFHLGQVERDIRGVAHDLFGTIKSTSFARIALENDMDKITKHVAAVAALLKKLYKATAWCVIHQQCICMFS